MGKEVGRPATIQKDAAGIRAGTERGERRIYYKSHFCAALRVDFPAHHPRYPPTGRSLLGAHDMGSSPWGKISLHPPTGASTRYGAGATRCTPDRVQSDSRASPRQAGSQIDKEIPESKGAWTSHLSCFAMFKNQRKLAENPQSPSPSPG